MTVRIGCLRFAKDGPPEMPWSCSDATRGCCRGNPLAAWLALRAWYRAEPRSHWPGCNLRHPRGALCRQALL